MKKFKNIILVAIIVTISMAVLFPSSFAKYKGKTQDYTVTVYSQFANTYYYTNAVQEFVVPVDGYYYIESWGGNGGRGGNKGSGQGTGGADGGIAQKAAGIYYLTRDTTIYIYVGSAGGPGLGLQK